MNKTEEKDIKTGKIYPYVQALPDIIEYQTISGAILGVLLFMLEFLFAFLLKSANKVALTSSDFAFLFTSWQGLLMILLGLLSIILYVMFELNGLVSLTGRLLKGESKIVIPSIKDGIYGIKKYLTPNGMLVLLFIALVVPLIGIGLSISITKNFYIPTFISSVIRTTPLYSVLYTIVMALSTIAALVYSFTVHGVMLDSLKVNKSMEHSRIMVVKNWKSFLGHNLRYLVVAGLFAILVVLISVMIPFIIVFIGQKEEYLRVAVITGCLIWSVLIAQFTALIQPMYIMKMTRLYRQYDSNEEVRYPVRAKKKHPLVIFGGIVVIGIIVGFVIIYNTYFDEIFLVEKKPAIIAHRGGGNEASENTVSGLLKAVELGAYGSEIDIQRTKDGHYVINHDTTFERVAGIKSKPEEMTLNEIKQLRVDGEPVATIEDMLDACHNRIVLFVELKGNSADNKMADDMVKMINERNMNDEVVLISLRYDLIDYIEDTYDNIQTGYLTLVSFGDISQLNCDYIGLEEESATARNIRSIHDNNKKVLVWTVNTEQSQHHFLKTSVDGIITDEISQANEVINMLDKRSDLDLVVDSLLRD